MHAGLILDKEVTPKIGIGGGLRESIRATPPGMRIIDRPAQKRPSQAVFCFPKRSGLMPKVPYAGVDHRHTTFISRSHHFVVAHAAARLDDARGAGINHHIEPITKREESVTRDHGVRQ